MNTGCGPQYITLDCMLQIRYGCLGLATNVDVAAPHWVGPLGIA